MNFTYLPKKLVHPKFMLSALACLSSFVALPMAKADHIIYQPGPDDGIDTFIDSRSWNSGNNYGASADLGAGHADTSNSIFDYSLLRFNLTSLPLADMVTSVHLKVYWTQSSGTGMNYFINHITSNWEENTVTWNSAPSWDPTPSASSYIEHPLGWSGWESWDITNLYKDWKRGSYANNGLIITCGTNNGEGSSFFSSEYAIASQRPMLEIDSGLWIVTQPQSQVGYWGKAVTLSVTASNGTPPYTYQWLKDGVEIDGATSSQLELTSLQAENAGSYTVTVMDVDNTPLLSDAAHLTVNPAGVSIATYAGLTIDGVIKQTYGIQASTDLSNPNGWVGVDNVKLAQSTQIWYDSQSTTQNSKRFYRVVAGPITIP